MIKKKVRHRGARCKTVRQNPTNFRTPQEILQEILRVVYNAHFQERSREEFNRNATRTRRKVVEEITATMVNTKELRAVVCRRMRTTKAVVNDLLRKLIGLKILKTHAAFTALDVTDQNITFDYIVGCATNVIFPPGAEEMAAAA